MKERIIVALDTDSPDKALETVAALAGEVGLFKVGMELFPPEARGWWRRSGRRDHGSSSI